MNGYLGNIITISMTFIKGGILMKIFVRFWVVFYVLGALSSFLGCAGLNKTVPPPLSQEDILKNIVTEYWQYKIDRSLEKAYLYEDPNSRQEVKLTDYLLSMGTNVKWVQVQIEHIEIKGENADISLRIRYYSTLANFNPEGGRESTITDYWIMKENSWYHTFGSQKQP